MLPGFIDTHLHPIALVYFDMNADLRGVRSIAALQQVLRDATARQHAAAYLQFEEYEQGSLTPGKRADLVVLSDDPLTVAPQQIAAIRVLRTVSGGRTVYDAEKGVI